MKHRVAIILLVAITILLVNNNTLLASLIFINNASFETTTALDQSSGEGLYNYDCTDWTCSGSRGILQPSTSAYSSGPPDGSNVAWSNGGSFSQTLSATLTANTTYTLQAYVGLPGEVTSFPGYSIGLYAGNTLLASDNSVNPASGTFALSTVTYMAGPNDSNLSQTLKIVLTSGGAQVNFDEISLNATPVPIPAALWLLGSGLVGLVGIRRKLRK